MAKEFSIRSKDRVCCIGAGYVGVPTIAMLAWKCRDLDVTVVDINEDRIAAWNSCNPHEFPLFEPGLSEMVLECRDRNLRFSSDVASAVAQCDLIYVCVNTHTNTTGLGAGRASNLGPWESAGRTIARYSSSNKIIIEKSTVSVRTEETLEAVLRCSSRDAGIEFVILSNPEFLAEGAAIKDLEFPDRVLIGGPRTSPGDYAIHVLKEVHTRWMPRDRIIPTNLWSSELSKLVANAMLAQRVS